MSEGPPPEGFAVPELAAADARAVASDPVSALSWFRRL
jgi:hypothetical protein